MCIYTYIRYAYFKINVKIYIYVYLGEDITYMCVK